MRTLVLIATLLVSSAAFAEKDAGVSDAGTSVMMAPVSIVGDPIVRAATDGGVADVQVDPAAAVGLLKSIFVAVKDGNWWLAAAGLLLLVVGLLRKFGKMAHEWLDDKNPLDKWFFHPLFDTKIGGWVLNWLTATAGGIGTGLLAGATVDLSLWKSVLMVSTSGTALIELWKDIKEWWDARKVKQAAAAGVAPPAAPGNPPAVK